MVSVSKNSSTATVFGGGEYYRGEYAQVTAMPSENDMFIGWYQDGKLVAEDINYKFRVENDCDLEAKFVSVSIDDLSLRYKESAQLTSGVEVAGGSYTIKYESSDSSVAQVDENGNIYTSGTGNTTITVTVTDEYGNLL